MYYYKLASNDTKFIPSFLKIDQVLEKLEWEKRHPALTHAHIHAQRQHKIL